MVGCSKPYVNKVLTKDSQQEKTVNTPPTIEGNSSKADFRKLPAELQEKVAAKEVSLNAAAIADAVGCSQQYVNKVVNKKFESNQIVHIPNHLTAKEAKADFRKLPPELREKVAAKEVSLNAAAIQAGIRKKPTPAEIKPRR